MNEAFDPAVLQDDDLFTPPADGAALFNGFDGFDGPDGPDGPDDAATSDDPAGEAGPVTGAPGATGMTAAPTTPETPETPENPEKPETPGKPETPEKPEKPEGTGQPEPPEAPGNSEGTGATAVTGQPAAVPNPVFEPAPAPAPTSTPIPVPALAPDPTQAGRVDGNTLLQDLQALQQAHPELASTGEPFPQEVLEAYARSGDLQRAYLEYRYAQQTRQIADLQQQLSVLQQNREAAARAPISRGLAGGYPVRHEAADPITAGFDVMY